MGLIPAGFFTVKIWVQNGWNFQASRLAILYQFSAAGEKHLIAKSRVWRVIPELADGFGIFCIVAKRSSCYRKSLN
jgi:hypothetical protein